MLLTPIKKEQFKKNILFFVDQDSRYQNSREHIYAGHKLKHHNIVYIVTVHNHIRAIESKLPLVACGRGWSSNQ